MIIEGGRESSLTGPDWLRQTLDGGRLVVEMFVVVKFLVKMRVFVFFA